MFAPVVLFVYNRKDLFLKTYNALKLCVDAKQTDLFIFSDGAKNKESELLVEDVRAELNRISNDCEFHSITIICSPVNKGLAKSIIEGVNQVITQYGRAIVLEDDCLPSPYLIKYMNSALDYYYEDKRIGSVAGYAEIIEIPKDYQSDIYLARRSCSWGWATWLDRWEKVDWKLQNVDKIFKNPRMIHRLNANGSDRLMRLYRQSKTDIQSWSICFGAYHVLNDLYVIYPRYSYIFSTGDDGSGVHTKKGEVTRQYDLSLAISNPKMEPIQYDARIQRRLKKRASTGFLSEMKRFFASVAIVLVSHFNKGKSE